MVHILTRCAKSPDFALLITIWLNNRASFSIPSVFSSLGRRSHLPLTKGRSFIQVITIYLLNFCLPISSPSLGGGWGEVNLLLPTAHSFKKISTPLNLHQYTPLPPSQEGNFSNIEAYINVPMY